MVRYYTQEVEVVSVLLRIRVESSPDAAVRLTCNAGAVYCKNMKFVLFDIDGTLIDSGGAGLRALNHAFKEMFSVPEAFKGISMAGKTDPQIIGEGLRLHGIKCSNGVVPEVIDRYLKHLEGNIDPLKGHVMAGIRDALDLLASDDAYLLGLLSGNVTRGARIKLEAYDLSQYFSIGAFGDDDADRKMLLPIALKKLREDKAVSLAYSDCVVIGDTPRDIECSKPYGAFAMAVATGPYPYGVLTEAGADIVFEDLSDTQTLMSTLAQLQ